MSYSFVRVTNYYPQYLKDYYLKNPRIHLKSYAEQCKALVSDSFETASSYTKNLNKIGVGAHDIISNTHILQNTWKRENNLSPDISVQELIIKQLKFYKPEVVWVDDFSIVDEQWKNQLLKEVPSLKLLIGHICAPYNSIIAAKLKLFDVMFTCVPCFKDELARLGVNSHLLYHGFEASALDGINNNNQYPESDFLFSGSLYVGSGFHTSRIEYVERMLEAGIAMDLYCNIEPWTKIIAKKSTYAAINFLKKLHAESLISKIPVLDKNRNYGDAPIKNYSKKLLSSIKPPVFGYEMYKLLSKAKTCFNIHGEIAQKCAGNIRLFEATGVGTCLITDWKENIKDLFEPDKEVVTYKSVEECIEKIKWLAANPIERERIAKAGQKRTLKDHTFESRAKVVNEVIQKEIR